MAIYNTRTIGILSLNLHTVGSSRRASTIGCNGGHRLRQWGFWQGSGNCQCGCKQKIIDKNVAEKCTPNPRNLFASFKNKIIHIFVLFFKPKQIENKQTKHLFWSNKSYFGQLALILLEALLPVIPHLVPCPSGPANLKRNFMLVVF